MPQVSRARPSLWSNSFALSMNAAVIQDHGEGQGGRGWGLISVQLQCSGETFSRTSLSMERIY